MQTKRGRPSAYTPELADEICLHISNGIAVKDLGRIAGMPSHDTVHRWIASNPEFRDKYTRAKELALERMAEEILTISDDATNDWAVNEDGTRRVDQENVQRSRLRVEARKWLLSKLMPKKYGDAVGAVAGLGAGAIQLVVMPAGLQGEGQKQIEGPTLDISALIQED